MTIHFAPLESINQSINMSAKALLLLNQYAVFGLCVTWTMPEKLIDSIIDRNDFPKAANDAHKVSKFCVNKSINQ